MKRAGIVPALGMGILMLAVGLAGWLAGQPWLFPSLGPTAWLQAETPDHPSARPWNTVAGHLCGMIAGYAAVYLFGLAESASVLETRFVSPERAAASAVALALTVIATTLLDASHPPAAATTLLISLGVFKLGDADSIIAGVGIVAVLGEGVRRWILRRKAVGEESLKKAA